MGHRISEFLDEGFLFVSSDRLRSYAMRASQVQDQPPVSGDMFLLAIAGILGSLGVLVYDVGDTYTVHKWLLQRTQKIDVHYSLLQGPDVVLEEEDPQEDSDSEDDM